MANISDAEAKNVARFLGRKGRSVSVAEVKAMPMSKLTPILNKMRPTQNKARGGVATKRMRGGGMAKTAKKKMARGGVAKKKMMRGGMAAKKRGK
jgi:hypothetical protein